MDSMMIMIKHNLGAFKSFLGGFDHFLMLNTICINFTFSFYKFKAIIMILAFCLILYSFAKKI